MKGIDQQLFDALYSLALTTRTDVYPSLPNMDAEYPFIVIGEVQVIPRQVKFKTIGKLHATVYVWGDGNNRRTVSDISESLMELYSSKLKLDTRYVKMNVDASSKRVLVDDSVDHVKLWRSILELEFDIF